MLKLDTVQKPTVRHRDCSLFIHDKTSGLCDVCTHFRANLYQQRQRKSDNIALGYDQGDQVHLIKHRNIAETKNNCKRKEDYRTETRFNVKGARRRTRKTWCRAERVHIGQFQSCRREQV